MEGFLVCSWISQFHSGPKYLTRGHFYHNFKKVFYSFLKLRHRLLPLSSGCQRNLRTVQSQFDNKLPLCVGEDYEKTPNLKNRQTSCTDRAFKRLHVESAINTQLCYNCFPLPSKPMSLEGHCGTVTDHITGKMNCTSGPGQTAC